MAIIDIRAALDRLSPGASYGWRGGDPSDFSQIIWRDDAPQPTQAALDAAWAEIEAERAAVAAALAAEEQASKDARQNIQFLMQLMTADEQQIRNWIASNGQEMAIVRLTQSLQFVLRWIRSRELRRPDLADDPPTQ